MFSAFNRLGKIMQRLTAITLIILVPNFVASIYGMNFHRMFPPQEWNYSFLAVNSSSDHGGVGVHPFPNVALALSGLAGPSHTLYFPPLGPGSSVGRAAD